MLYRRLHRILDKHQCYDQIGFRSKMRIENAFAICESLIGTTRAFNLLLWVASLDLSKAFDKIEFDALFAALTEQDVPLPYINLLKALYSNQRGSCDGKTYFQILRGVK